MKVTLAVLLLLFSVNSNIQAQDNDGFYVIPFPVPTDEIVEVEVCNGTPIGNVVFTITGQGNYVATGKVYTTTTGHLVEITGGYADTNGDDDDTETFSFSASPNSLPLPIDSDRDGVKGPFFVIKDGDLAYARFL